MKEHAFVDAANSALDAAEVNAAEVDTVVTISSTGVATPSLEARVARPIGFRAVSSELLSSDLVARAVSRGSQLRPLAQSRRGSTVLLVAAEFCSLAFRLDELTKANIVATALFGNGAAAHVLQASEAGNADVELSGQSSPQQMRSSYRSVSVPRMPR